jgi:ATP-dependent Clp protease adapter protein ClpS
VDLTKDDYDTMRRVVELVETVGDKTDDESRHLLMSAGHDPLRS